MKAMNGQCEGLYEYLTNQVKIYESDFVLIGFLMCKIDNTFTNIQCYNIASGNCDELCPTNNIN